MVGSYSDSPNESSSNFGLMSDSSEKCQETTGFRMYFRGRVIRIYRRLDEGSGV